MSTYGQYCPVSQAISVFGERWTPLVIRELLQGSHRFNDIRRGVPLMSPTLLSQRLRTLEAAGIVETRATGRGREYYLTEAGQEFRPIVEALGAWGIRWARSEHIVERDPAMLMWDVHRRLALDRFPEGRTVVSFHFPDATKGKRSWWLVVEGGDVDVCLTDPGYTDDLRVTARLQSMIDVWSGNVRIADAIRNETIVLEGARRLQQAFPSWLLLSIFAGVPRPESPKRRLAGVAR